MSERCYTYVVIQDTNTQWGFMGFDADTEVLFVGSRKACADWIVSNSDSDHLFIVVNQEKYEEQYVDGYGEDDNA